MNSPRREKRKQERRSFSSYMQFRDARTAELVGDLADLAPSGFRLECTKPVAVNATVPFAIDVPPGISYKASIVFTARSVWSKQHPVDTRLHEVGFEIVQIDPADSAVFRKIGEQYGSSQSRKDSGADYLWR